MEDQIHPLSSYLIIPLFAFANAGIYLLDVNPATVIGGISIAIIVGLIAGKFLGIFIFSWLTVKLGLAPMPEKADWKMMAAISMLGGIGFTVSLFIAGLTFGDGSPKSAQLLSDAKLGIVIGSFISGLCGYLLLKVFLPKTDCVEKQSTSHESCSRG